jgi:hypothetical protein
MHIYSWWNAPPYAPTQGDNAAFWNGNPNPNRVHTADVFGSVTITSTVGAPGLASRPAVLHYSFAGDAGRRRSRQDPFWLAPDVCTRIPTESSYPASVMSRRSSCTVMSTRVAVNPGASSEKVSESGRVVMPKILEMRRRARRGSCPPTEQPLSGWIETNIVVRGRYANKLIDIVPTAICGVRAIFTSGSWMRAVR